MKHYILLDRSGSMSGRWEEAKSALQEYANTIDETDTIILRTFDSSTEIKESNAPAWGGKMGLQATSYSYVNTVETISSTSAKDFKGIPETVYPRGMTPLYDAVGSTLAEADNERAVVIVITDGQENSSTKFKHTDVRKLMEAKKEAGVEVLFIGADFNNMTDAAVMGVELNTRTAVMNRGEYVGAMTTLASNTRAYASGLDADVLYGMTSSVFERKDGDHRNE